MSEPPLVVVIGGPNGAGKTTTAPRILQGALAVPQFVNADPIAQGLSFFRPASMSVAAGRVMLARLKVLAAAREDFAFETTLASRSFAPWLLALRASGYRSHLIFLSLADVEIAIARVAQRVRQGGHDVPESTIRRRFLAGLRNFFTLYRPVVDSWQMFDNSETTGPRMIAFGEAGFPDQVLDEKTWKRLLELQR